MNGDLTVEDNHSAATVAIGAVTVDSELTVVDNGRAAVVADSIERVNGNLTLESTGAGPFSAGVCAGGRSAGSARHRRRSCDSPL